MSTGKIILSRYVALTSYGAMLTSRLFPHKEHERSETKQSDRGSSSSADNHIHSDKSWIQVAYEKKHSRFWLHFLSSIIGLHVDTNI